jgi:hypothetical protein
MSGWPKRFFKIKFNEDASLFVHNLSASRRPLAHDYFQSRISSTQALHPSPANPFVVPTTVDVPHFVTKNVECSAFFFFFFGRIYMAVSAGAAEGVRTLRRNTEARSLNAHVSPR